MAGIVNEAYTLDVNVQEAGAAEASVNVRAWDDAGTSVLDKTTDAQGDITPTVLIAEEHSITLTSTRNTTVFNPFNLRSLKWLLRVLDVSINLSAPSKQTLFMESNPSITETVQATVQAYTGITFNHTTDTVTLDGLGVTPVNDMNRFYDRAQDEAIVNEQVDPPEVLRTNDKQNYNLEYDWVVDGFDFDGQDRAVALAANQNLTIQSAGGNISDITVTVSGTGDVLLNVEADLSNVTINGDLRINTGANSTLTFTNVTVTGQVWNDASANTLTINLSGGSMTAGDPGTANGQTNIQNTKNFTVIGLDTGSRVVWLTRPGEVELENKLESGGSATYTYNYTVDTDIWISILSTDKFVELKVAQLLNQDQTLDAGQSDDPFYSNPP